MAYTPRKQRPWLKSHAAQPEPASLLALLLFFSLAFASFAGCVALLFAHSLRDIHFERHPGDRGAALTVDWRFTGHRFWRRHWPDIVNVEARQVAVTGVAKLTGATWERWCGCLLGNALCDPAA